jgi:nucleoid-associated protein YgaU
MRKEVRLGMTVGGGLLAIIVVGAVALNHKSKNHHGVDTTTALMNDSTGGSGDVGGQTTDDSAVKPLETPASTKPPAAAPTKPEQPIAKVESKHDAIDALLNGGSTPLISRTPDNNPSAGDGAAADRNAPSGDQSPISNLTDPNAPKAIIGPVSPATQPSSGVAGTHTHRVQKGETFSTIAAAAYGSANFYPYIMRANPTIDAKALKPNMVIKLPDISEVKPPEKAATKSEAVPAAHKTEVTLDAATEYRVVAGDSLNKISIKLYGKIDMVNKLYEANKATIGPNPAALKLNQILKLPQPPTAPATAAAR